MFCVTHDAKLILSAGHSDNSLHVYSVAKNKTTQYISGHTGQLHSELAMWRNPWSNMHVGLCRQKYFSGNLLTESAVTVPQNEVLSLIISV